MLRFRYINVQLIELKQQQKKKLNFYFLNSEPEQCNLIDCKYLDIIIR